MIEPTESESLAEIDKFCDAMIAIKQEINQIVDGTYMYENSMLRNAPHTAECAVSSDWDLLIRVKRLYIRYFQQR